MQGSGHRECEIVYGMIYWIWLCGLKGIGPHTQRTLLEKFLDPKKIYYASEEELRQIGISEKRVRTIMEGRSLDPAEKVLNDCKRFDISMMNISQEIYPDRMRDIKDMPVLMYYKGEAYEPAKTSGIVGPRKCSRETKDKTIDIATRCIQSGDTIVSGMALGVDGYAHTAAIRNGGKTIAIVGSGLDICYPKAHDTLFEKIQQHGFVMSEYPPGTPPLAFHFPKRNQIIAVMSDELYVIDPGRNSGSLITAEYKCIQR